ncbi:hypothetical protein C900_01311 [Fulvivirga imtechensis AK7]|uniref:Uncharacterized protein n=1 Tax=Fulvivirga imtechensis AK7 TaxID=1237149 RepID=L8JWF3_9BACT|nr:hypothetical protein C900_01311 [Fulvivirga imtechensis AK7]
MDHQIQWPVAQRLEYHSYKVKVPGADELLDEAIISMLTDRQVFNSRQANKRSVGGRSPLPPQMNM